MFSLQVTIRASLTGKSPALPVSPKQPGFVVSTESLSVNHPIKPHVTVSKSKPTTSETGKAKMPQSKKQNPQSKHNLALSNLRLATFSHSTQEQTLKMCSM